MQGTDDQFFRAAGLGIVYGLSTVRVSQPSSLGRSWNLNCSVTEGLYEQQINKRLYFVRSRSVHGEEHSNYSRNLEMECCWFRMSNSDVPADVTLNGGVSDFRRCGAPIVQDQTVKDVNLKKGLSVTPDQKRAQCYPRPKKGSVLPQTKKGSVLPQTKKGSVLPQTKKGLSVTTDQKTALTKLSPGAYETCSDIQIPII